MSVHHFRELGGAVLLLLGASAASGQVDRATLSGTVRDTSNALVPTASVTITNTATGVATRLTTTNEATYLVVDLAAGEYRVQVEAPGFRRAEQVVIVEVGQRARLDVVLSVAGVSETITVGCHAVARQWVAGGGRGRWSDGSVEIAAGDS